MSVATEPAPAAAAEPAPLPAVTVDRAELEKALAWVTLALPERPVVPVLAGVMATVDASGALALEAFDYGVSARARVDGENAAAGRVLVRGHLLAKAVKGLPKAAGARVELTGTAAGLALRCGGASGVVESLPAQDYPSLPPLAPLAGTVDARALARGVARVSVAASKDGTLPALTCVRLAPGAHALELEALDRYRLAADAVPWAGAGEPGDAALLPARDLARFAAKLGHCGHVGVGVQQAEDGQGGFVSLSAGARHATIRVCVPPPHAGFPETGRLWPRETATAVRFDAPALLAVVKRALALAGRPGTLLADTAAGALVIRATAEDGAVCSTESVPAAVSGDGAATAFNGRYLADALSAFAGEVTASFEGRGKPMTLTEGGSPCRVLLMPIRREGKPGKRVPGMSAVPDPGPPAVTQPATEGDEAVNAPSRPHAPEPAPVPEPGASPAPRGEPELSMWTVWRDCDKPLPESRHVVIEGAGEQARQAAQAYALKVWGWEAEQMTEATTITADSARALHERQKAEAAGIVPGQGGGGAGGGDERRIQSTPPAQEATIHAAGENAPSPPAGGAEEDTPEARRLAGEQRAERMRERAVQGAALTGRPMPAVPVPRRGGACRHPDRWEPGSGKRPCPDCPKRKDGAAAGTTGSPALPSPEAIEAARALLRGTLDELRGFHARYVYLSREAARAMLPLWTAHTYHRRRLPEGGGLGRLAWSATPRLMIIGGFESGKSTVLEVLRVTCANTFGLDHEPTASGMIDSINDEHATLLFDEAALLIGSGKRKSDVVTALLGGYRPNGTKLRTRGGKSQRLSLFAPVALTSLPEIRKIAAGNENIAAMLSRAIIEEMAAPPEGVAIADFAADEEQCEAEGARYRAALLSAMTTLAGELAAARPVMPQGVRGRRAQIWRPLLAICEAAGGHWIEDGRAACREFCLGERERPDLPPGVELLNDMRAVWPAAAQVALTTDLAAALLAVDGAPWRGMWDAVSAPSGMAALLAPYGVTPVDVFLPDGRGTEGYRLACAEPAWEEHCPPAADTGDDDENDE